MTENLPSTRNERPSALLAIFWGGLACGVLDLTQAFIAWGIKGATPVRILQGVAFGVLGRASFQGGAKSAAIGALCHFTAAFGAATVYYLASRKLAFLTQHPVICGLLYGEVVLGVMNFVVMPLSRIGHGPATSMMPWIVTGPILHPFLVGLPIALAVSYFAPLPYHRS